MFIINVTSLLFTFFSSFTFLLDQSENLVILFIKEEYSLEIKMMGSSDECQWKVKVKSKTVTVILILILNLATLELVLC